MTKFNRRRSNGIDFTKLTATLRAYSLAIHLAPTRIPGHFGNQLNIIDKLTIHHIIKSKCATTHCRTGALAQLLTLQRRIWPAALQAQREAWPNRQHIISIDAFMASRASMPRRPSVTPGTARQRNSCETGATAAATPTNNPPSATVCSVNPLASRPARKASIFRRSFEKPTSRMTMTHRQRWPGDRPVALRARRTTGLRHFVCKWSAAAAAAGVEKSIPHHAPHAVKARNPQRPRKLCRQGTRLARKNALLSRPANQRNAAVARTARSKIGATAPAVGQLPILQDIPSGLKFFTVCIQITLLNSGNASLYRLRMGMTAPLHRSQAGNSRELPNSSCRSQTTANTTQPPACNPALSPPQVNVADGIAVNNEQRSITLRRSGAVSPTIDMAIGVRHLHAALGDASGRGDADG